ncbi:MAG: DUF418 domain-containing protein [Phycisphaeraceae bacterium]
MAQPIPINQRIEVMDMLRGIAILGILLININSFALPLDALFELTEVGYDHAIDAWVYASVTALAGGKFMSMFALLFGAGVALMVDRRRQIGEPTAVLHYRRVGALAGLGLIHGIFIWHGDILLPYAIVGAILYPLLLLTGRKLLWICIVAWVLVLLSTLGVGALAAWAETMASEGEMGAGVFDNEIELMRGGLLGIMKVRFVHWLIFFFIGLFMGLPWVLALMTTGALAKRSGWITGERSRRDYQWLMLAGLVVGLPIAVMRVALSLWSDSYLFVAVEMTMNVIDATALCFAWGAFVVLISRALSSVWLGRALAAVGRMALTNYLMQSILCTMLFYGYGLGLFATMSRAELLIVVLGVWALQLLWSPWWLSRHERGPMEAVWRKLTYPKFVERIE